MNERPPITEQAKSASLLRPDFTNCGKAKTQKALVKPAKPKLTRVPFKVSAESRSPGQPL